MPTPFEGFRPPTENWSKLPHEFIGALPLVETVGEMKVILYILRHTWGFQDAEKRITIDEFVSGRKRRDGSRLDSGTGLSAPTVRDGLARAEEHGFIAVEVDERDKGRIKKYYSLVMQGEKILPPDSKDFTLQEQKILPRTEKDTSERNPGDIPIGRVSAPLMPEPIVPVVEEDLAPKKKGPPPAALVYQEVHSKSYLPVKTSWPELEKIQGEEDLQFWREVVTEYIMLGWNDRNLSTQNGMLKWYRLRKIPCIEGKETQGNANRPRNDQGVVGPALRAEIRASRGGVRGAAVEAEAVV